MSKQDLENKLQQKKADFLEMKEDDEGYAALGAEIQDLEQQLANFSEDDNSDGVDPVEAEVQRRLKTMKENMDRMAKERDAALKEKVRLEQERKQAEIKRLEEEGKLTEAAEMRANELQARVQLLEEENTRLNRDSVLQASLSGLDFRNDRSREMAYRDIVDQLIQNDSGQWVHRSGISIGEFVASYSKDDNNSFLFRVKSNTGAGTSTSAGNSDTTPKKSILQMSSNEVLELARKGQLGNFKY